MTSAAILPIGSAFGPLLARMRRRAGLSQLAFALEAGLSARHLSFLEVGRARPSVAMVERLILALGSPPSEAARLRHAAGFASDMEADAARLGLPVADQLAIHAFQAATDIGTAPDPETAAELAGRFFERIGIGLFATGIVRRASAFAPVEIEMHRTGRPAFGWLQHFRQRGYRSQDALVARTAARPGAFFWSDIDRSRLSRMSLRILDEAGDFRIRDGFVISVPQLDGTIRAFTSWAERADTDPSSRLAAQVVASALVESNERFDIQPLTQRLPMLQRELLLALRDGQTMDSVARRHGFDLAAIRTGLRQACLDLGAHTPRQAAARASALGLLTA